MACDGYFWQFLVPEFRGPEKDDIEAIRIVLVAESKRLRRKSARFRLAISQAIRIRIFQALQFRFFSPFPFSVVRFLSHPRSSDTWSCKQLPYLGYHDTCAIGRPGACGHLGWRLRLTSRWNGNFRAGSQTRHCRKHGADIDLSLRMGKRNRVFIVGNPERLWGVRRMAER